MLALPIKHHVGFRQVQICNVNSDKKDSKDRKIGVAISREISRNPDRNWWHRHTSVKLFFFWPQPMAPWTAGVNHVILTYKT